ncbi:MAG: glycosyltransferase family 2 protein [Bacteroidota bacterium]
MHLYSMAALAASAAMALVFLSNMIWFRRARSRSRGGEEPMVSILVPARNEEGRIGPALRSLAVQEYARFEVIVLDDGSTDGTLAEAEAAAAKQPHVRIFQGGDLPPGWTGKNHACRRLFEASRGDLLLFTDADTVHHRLALHTAASELRENRLGLLSMIPRQVTGGFWERLLVPLLHFATLPFLPFGLVRHSRRPSLAMANGQFMLFRRDVYERIGTHAAVKGAMVEDVWLARAVKKAGFRMEVMDGSDLVSCRMYRSLGEIWGGFSKNLFAGFNYSLAGFLPVLGVILATSVVPFPLAAAGIWSGAWGEEWFLTAALQAGLVLGMRLAMAARFRTDLPSALLHPLAAGILVAIGLNSVRWVLGGGGARWKGRRYGFHRHVAAQPEQTP